MNSHHDDNKTPTKRVRILPEPNLANITVLTDKLPNTPIFPWNHYDSPWLEAQRKSEIENETDTCD
ncbi:hypothetical protein [Iningainema tapete]|uniref:Uncharacterized protein n=1 Tax=Iningainema tapete BLCC-T55 TaxID=2748662 RepID=A0A8J7CI76_9CYAN|nr:hypothetical protein [Iningainema tapete]MBD2778695.1 hypothetical protein [Iningainema tapete BLCC-T55]